MGSPSHQNQSLHLLLKDVRACTICANDLEAGVRPIVQVHADARILIAGQAPGRRVHLSGIPFDDPSGERLRQWMGITRETFYDPEQVSILPMGFCYPGTGKTGDLAPRAECAPAWRRALLDQMKQVQLTLVIGRYAIDWHLAKDGLSLTERVAKWKDYLPGTIPLPHPSPRNNRWLKRNPRFESELVPDLRKKVAAILAH